MTSTPTDSLPTNSVTNPKRGSSAGPNSESTLAVPTPMGEASTPPSSEQPRVGSKPMYHAAAPTDIPVNHMRSEIQPNPVDGDQTSDSDPAKPDTHTTSVAVAQTSTTPASGEPVTILDSLDVVDPKLGSAERGHSRGDDQTRAAALADPTIALLAEVLDDLERTRIANENRLRQFTRPAGQEDKDGVTGRGFGFSEDHPVVARQIAVVEGIADLEKQAEKNLTLALRAHPLHPWIKAQRGIGDKQAARLLASIGDPYWNTLEDRPRLVSELWSYCGWVPGRRRQRGQQANWSSDAKMRSYLVAVSCMKQPSGTKYRDVYEARRLVTADRVHAEECKRCGPSGKPAQPESPWNAGHQLTDALRVVAKEILRDLWKEARKIHGVVDTP